MYIHSREFKILVLVILVLVGAALVIISYAFQLKISQESAIQGVSTQVCAPGEQRSCGTCNSCNAAVCMSVCNEDGTAWNCVSNEQVCR